VAEKEIGMARTTTDERMQHLETATHATPREPFTFDDGLTVRVETVTDPVTGTLTEIRTEVPNVVVLNPGEILRVDHPYVLARPQHFKAVTSTRTEVETMTAAPGEKRGARVRA
jgi:hypothetical protein